MRRIKTAIVVLAGMYSIALAGNSSTDFGVAVRKFSALRQKQAMELSSGLNLPLPGQADAFFQVAVTGNWASVSNSFDQLLTPPAGRIPQLNNELWAPIHEAMGIWEVWVGWKKDSSLLAMFHEPILASMPKGSIYFGGTDYGRFIITTVNALMEPQPVFCITQNAVADNTYSDYLRAIYGNILWIPKKEDAAQAFQQYMDDVQSGKRAKNAEIKIENGRVQVSGVSGVMEINGILCRMIFDHNKNAHEFFVEESYVINWMYPYLEPHGLIMKLNPEPLDKLSELTVAGDRKFWSEQVQRLEAHPGFAANVEARKAFSKLRSAIAGLYAYRKMYGEAEAAFRQAIRLCPSSPEASSRLAKMFEEQGRMGEAIEVMDSYLKSAPLDAREKAEEYLGQLKEKMQGKSPEPARNPADPPH